MLAGRSVEVLGAPTDDATVLRQALATAEPGVFRIDYGQLMRSIDGVLRGSELPVVLDLVTDVQQTSLPTRFAELAPRRAAEISDSRRRRGAGRQLGDRQLRRLRAHGRARSERAQLREGRRGEDADLVVGWAHRSTSRRSQFRPAAARQARFAALELEPGSNRVTVTLSAERRPRRGRSSATWRSSGRSRAPCSSSRTTRTVVARCTRAPRSARSRRSL